MHGIIVMETKVQQIAGLRKECLKRFKKSCKRYEVNLQQIERFEKEENNFKMAMEILEEIVDEDQLDGEHLEKIIVNVL